MAGYHPWEQKATTFRTVLCTFKSELHSDVFLVRIFLMMENIRNTISVHQVNWTDVADILSEVWLL